MTTAAKFTKFVWMVYDTKLEDNVWMEDVVKPSLI